jgi:hypothetical protein
VRRPGRAGATLTIVLVAGLAVWALLAGLLTLALTHHRVALRMREHAVADRLVSDALAAWSADPDTWSAAGTSTTAEHGTCTTRVDVLERGEGRLRLLARAVVGTTTVSRGATLHGEAAP